MPTTYTPAVRQLTTLQTVVEAYMQLSGLSDTEIDDVMTAGINAGIGRINTRIWRKLVSSANFTMVAGTANYDFNTVSANDFREPITLIRLNSSSKRDGRIEFKDFQSFIAEHPSDTTSGSPQFYTVRYNNRDILLDVTPSSSFATNYPTLQLWYHRTVDELSNSTDTIDIPPEYDWFLIWHTMFWLAEHMGDSRKADRALSMAEQQWAMLVRQDNEITSDWAVSSVSGW